jgi:tetratricopeptide (TPR) repeat protein
MKNLLLIPAILCASALQCIAVPDYNNEWLKGTVFYDQKLYDSAAWYFEQIAALKPNNAEIYYNLGNTYYRLNKIAPAVLNYERALKVSPGYTLARENLALAQGRISNAIPNTGDIFFINWWQSITRADKAGMWAISALVCFIAIMALLALKRFKRNINFPVQVTGILAFVFLCFLALAFASSAIAQQHTAVVMQEDTPLMNGGLKGKPLLLVPEGTTVKIKNKNGDWIEVALPNGRTGWIQENLVDKI